MLFWSRAADAASPNVRQRPDSNTDGLFWADAEFVNQVEETADSRHNQLELIQSSASGWGALVRSAGRRTFDIVFSLLALFVTLPLMIVIVLTIRLSSAGPAFYRQRRLGVRGRSFDCLKFRTMVADAEGVLTELLARRPELKREFEEKHKLTNDPRITRVGHLLRKTSLDELPQFLNVLKGDMSVVGPRPIVSEETDRYGQFLPLVLSVRPGITGLWQVSGRNDTTYEERVELDCYYVKNRSLLLDLKIIFKTVWVLAKPSNGAY